MSSEVVASSSVEMKMDGDEERRREKGRGEELKGYPPPHCLLEWVKCGKLEATQRGDAGGIEPWAGRASEVAVTVWSILLGSDGIRCPGPWALKLFHAVLPHRSFPESP